MKKTKTITCTIMSMMIICFSMVANANDIRVLNNQADTAKAALVEKASNEKIIAEQQAAESKALILKSRSKLEAEITDLQKKTALIEQEIAELTIVQTKLAKKEQEVSLKIATTDQIINELVGVIRINAKDIETLITQNHQTALLKLSPDLLKKLVDENNFPGMDGIHLLADSLFAQIEKTAEVSRSVLPIIDRDGKTIIAETLVLGPFCAVYRLENDEVGFLRYSTAGRQFYALTKLPPRRMQKQLIHYFDAKSDSLPMDITRGAGLQQLSHSLNLWEQVEKGGPIVWPILVIFVLGLLIIIERVFFITRKHFDSDRFMRQLSETAKDSNWSGCEEYCNGYLKKPIARVLNAGLHCRALAREEIENVLQEAILREIPPMERFLSTLGMLAAISPLLGLLGTVTGMINTFHIITLHGTGDPKLMSGGISEALVTTMLGLGVAIPLMVGQTLLNRSVENEIGSMEEKAVALVNMIHKSKIKSCNT